MFIKLTNAVNALEADIYKLDDKNNNRFYHKFQNGKVARSAQDLTQVSRQVFPQLPLEATMRDKLMGPLEKVGEIVKKYSRMRDEGGFNRFCFCCISQESNTEKKLAEAIEAFLYYIDNFDKDMRALQKLEVELKNKPRQIDVEPAKTALRKSFAPGS